MSEDAGADLRSLIPTNPAAALVGREFQQSLLPLPNLTFADRMVRASPTQTTRQEGEGDVTSAAAGNSLKVVLLPFSEVDAGAAEEYVTAEENAKVQEQRSRDDKEFVLDRKLNKVLLKFTVKKHVLPSDSAKSASTNAYATIGTTFSSALFENKNDAGMQFAEILSTNPNLRPRGQGSGSELSFYLSMKCEYVDHSDKTHIVTVPMRIVV